MFITIFAACVACSGHPPRANEDRGMASNLLPRVLDDALLRSIHLPPQNTSSRFLRGVPQRRVYFDGCYNGQSRHTMKILKMGILMDRGYYERAGNNDLIATRTAYELLHYANKIYQEQFSIRLRIEKLLFAKPGHSIVGHAQHTWMNSAPSSTEHAGSCAVTGPALLTSFTAWVAENFRKQYALWHLLTACAGSIGGRANVARVCERARGGRPMAGIGFSGWDTYPVRVVVFAHEIGHNLGASKNHASEGIMSDDSLQPKYDGIAQISPEQQHTMCPVIARSMRRCRRRRNRRVTRDIARPARRTRRKRDIAEPTCWVDEVDVNDECSRCRGNGVCDEECNVEACGFDDGECQCAPECSAAARGDNICTPACMNEDCGYDDGDCDAPRCQDDNNKAQALNSQYTCSTMAPHCENADFGHIIRQACPQSCGICRTRPPVRRARSLRTVNANDARETTTTLVNLVATEPMTHRIGKRGTRSTLLSSKRRRANTADLSHRI